MASTALLSVRGSMNSARRRVLIGCVVVVAVVRCACAWCRCAVPCAGRRRAGPARPASPPPSPGRRRGRRAGRASGTRASTPRYRPARRRRRARSACRAWWSSASGWRRSAMMRSLSRDQLVRRRRGKAAADADRPGIAGEQAVAADRGGEQRAGALGQRDQAPPSAPEMTAPRPARTSGRSALGQRIGQPAHARGIGMQRAGRRRQRERRRPCPGTARPARRSAGSARPSGGRAARGSRRAAYPRARRRACGCAPQTAPTERTISACSI